MQPFVTVGIQRTGTTLLVTSLDSHPDIMCHGDTFLSDRKAHYECYRNFSWKRRLGHYLDRRRQMRCYLTDFYMTPGYAAIGFKLMQSQARRYPMVWEYLREQEVKVIRVVRCNQLKILVSRILSKRTGIPHSTSRFCPPRLHLPTWNLKRRLDSITRENERWSILLADVEFLPVVYERVLCDRQAEFRRILEFLRVDSNVALHSPYQKIAPNRLPDIIENYADVVRCISGTRHERYLS